MTIIPEDYAEASLRFTVPGSGSPAYVVIGLDPADPSDPAAIAESVFDKFTDTNSVMELLSNDVVLNLVRVVVGQSGGPDLVGEHVELAVGGDDDDSAPPQVTFLVQKRTGFVGRAFQGRSYLPGVAEGAVADDGQVASGKQAAMAVALPNWLNGLIAADNPMVLLHTDAALPPTPVTQLLLDSRVATQRRRLR